MANGTPSSVLATRITIDDMQAVESLRGLKSQVSTLMNSWKAQNAMLQSVGDNLGAAKSRYEGLGDAIAKQEEYITRLKQQLETLDTSTTKGAESYARLEKQLATAQKQLANFNAQQQRASKSMNYYSSGIDKIEKSLKNMTASSNLSIEKLKSQGKTYEANYQQSRLYANQLEKMGTIYQKQSNSLNKLDSEIQKNAVEVEKAKQALSTVESTLNKTTNEYNQQKRALEELAKTGSTTSSAYQKQKEKVESLSNSLNKLKTEYNSAQSDARSAIQAQNSLKSSYSKTESSMEKLDTEMAKTKASQDKLNESFTNNHLAVAKLRDSYNKVSESVGKVKSSVTETAGKVATGAVAMGTAVAGLSAGFVAASKSASEMQNTYTVTSNLLVTGGEKTAEVTKNVAQMQKNGREYSLEYGKSQREIADAYQDLIKRGDNSKQALGAMRSEVQASVATGDELKDVTEVTSNVMESFGMKVDKNGQQLQSTAEMTKRTKTAVNDLAYAADKTSTNFQDLGIGMSYVGATAHGAGISLSETASAMGILSNNGLEADKAGTGLRKVINSLSTAVKNINSSDSPLKKLGITKNDLVDSNGNLKTLSSIMSVLGQKTKNMGTADKNVVFNSLFGTTGQQAGEILAQNASRLSELNTQVERSTKENYVGKLAEKNMGTAENAMKRFKAVGQDVEMTLASAVLPTVSKMAETMSRVADTKGFRQMVSTVGNGVSAVGNKLQAMFNYIGKNSDAFTSMGKSLATIIGELGSGIWTTFSGTIKVISRSILGMFGDKSTGNAAKDLAKALSDMAEHKQAIKAIGEAFATYFIAKKMFSFSSSIYSIVKAMGSLQEAIDTVKGGGSILDAISGLKNKGKITEDVTKSAEDISIRASRAGARHMKKGGLFERYTHLPKWMKSSVTRDAESLGKQGATAAETAAGKGGFFRKLFSVSPVEDASLATKGLRLGGKLVGGLNLAISAVDIGKGLMSHGTARYTKVGSGIGSLIGTGIGMIFGGPVGAAIGGLIGNWAGKMGGNLAHKAVQAYQKAGGWKGISKDIVKMTNNLRGKISSFTNDLHKKWRDTFTDLQKITQNTRNPIVKTTGEIGLSLMKSFSAFGKNIHHSWSSTWKQISNDVQNSHGNILKMWGNIALDLGKGMARFEKNNLNGWYKFWGNIGKEVAKDSKPIINQSKKMFSTLGKDLQGFVKDGSKRWHGFWNDAENLAKKSNIGKITKNTFDGITKTIRSANSQNDKSVANSQNNQTKSFLRGRSDRTKSMSEESKEIIRSIDDETKQVITLANNEYKQRVNIAQKQYNDVVKRADETRDDTIKAANDKYNQVVKAANEEYSGTDKASTQQRDAVIAHAKKQHDDTISAANDQRANVVRHAERQRDSSIQAAQKQRDTTVSTADNQRDLIKQAANDQSHGVVEHATNQANSTMRANSSQANGLGKIWSAIVSFFNKLTKPFGVSSISTSSLSTSAPTIGGLAYAKGGSAKGGKALVGEAGPELRYKPYSGHFDILGSKGAELAELEDGDEILNANDTQKLLSGNYLGTLPGYANGTTDLESFIKKVKDKAEDIFKNVKDDALDALKNIGNPVDKLKDIAKKAFNLDSVKDLGSVPRDISKGAVDKSIKGIGDFISKLVNKVKDHLSSDVNGIEAKNIGKGAGNWRSVIEKVAKATHTNVSDSDMEALLARIQKESGGDQSIKQQVWDVNMANGDPAEGLFQYIPPTFAAWAVSGHTNILSGEDQIYAVFNDSNWRSDIRMPGGWGPTGHKVFANGGIATEASIFGENGPEMAIPLASPKRSRGYELLGKVVSMFAADEKANSVPTGSDNDRMEELLEQNNALMQTLIQVATGQLNVMKDNGNVSSQVAKGAFYNMFGMDQKRTNFQTF